MNEDHLKFPIMKNDQSGISIAFKIIQNPSRINDVDDLYEAFEVNSDSNVKYFVMFNPCNKRPAEMTLQQKIFRKFFYENSSHIENEVKFIEITDSRAAKRIGINSEDEIFVFQNKNPFG